MDRGIASVYGQLSQCTSMAYDWLRLRQFIKGHDEIVIRALIINIVLVQILLDSIIQNIKFQQYGRKYLNLKI